MSLLVEELGNQLKGKWVERIEKRQRNKTYAESGKKTVTCKCPRCGMRHESYILWTGRGMPRIFCVSCRQRVNSYCEIAYECASAVQTKSGRRPGQQALE